MTSPMATKSSRVIQIAILEALLLKVEILASLDAEVEGLHAFIESECGVGSKDLAAAFETEVDEPMAYVSNALTDLIDRIVQYLELPKGVLGDRSVEKLLERQNAVYTKVGEEDCVETFVPASLGVLMWKLADRLRFLTEQSYETDEAVKQIEDPPYVVDLKLE